MSTTTYRMNGAFDLADAQDLSGETDENKAVRFAWSELANDMRDEIEFNCNELVYVSHTLNGDDVNVVFTAPIDNLEEFLLGVEKV